VLSQFTRVTTCQLDVYVQYIKDALAYAIHEFLVTVRDYGLTQFRFGRPEYVKGVIIVVNCGAFAQPLFRWKNKNAFLFYCCHTYVSIRNVVNTNNIAIEAQQCLLGIAALHILLSKS